MAALPQARRVDNGAAALSHHFVSESQIALLLIYPKNEKDDLTADERKALKRIIETWR